MTNNFITLHEFSSKSLKELEENFIDKYTEFKASYSYILKLCDIKYDALCKMLLDELTIVFNSPSYTILYNEQVERGNDHLDVFGTIYDSVLIEETIETFYTQLYNIAHIDAVLMVQKKLTTLNKL
jgi:hypothetical protein